MHEAAHIPNLAPRIQQPMYAYEDAIAATKGIREVSQRRLPENAIGWPNQMKLNQAGN